MQNNGFILLHRKLLNSDVFASQKLLKIWIWCLLKANYRDKTIPYKIGRGETIIKVKRGTFIFGRFRAEEELSIDGSTIYKSIKSLEQYNMISIKSNSHYSVITIVNYDDYQDLEKKVTTKEQPSNNQVTTKEQPSNTTNKDNNENKEIKKEERSKIKIFSEDVNRCFSECLVFFPEHLHPSTESIKNKWLDTIDKLNRIDNIPFNVIIEITKWAREDDFWGGNFLSLPKLRNKDRNGIKYILVFNEKFRKNGIKKEYDYEEIRRKYPNV